MKAGWVAWCCGAALLCGLSCAPKEPTTFVFALAVAVDDGDGEPVAGARVVLDDAGEVVSDAQGNAQVTTTGKEGESRRVLCVCPEGTLLQGDAEKQVRLRRIFRGDAATNTASQKLSFVCTPLQRSHVLVVHAHGLAQVPVQVNGTVVAHTDDAGIAHVAIHGMPEDVVEVALETSQFARWLPQHPTRRFVLPSQSRFLVFDQWFEMRKLPKPKRKMAPPKALGPVRL
ncbi:MAG: DUF4198 domain-containing protein [Proteobacteria bacterium]|nr:DUF4198 domain-containing protein [Pseudomonadota bacterium]